MALNIRNPWSLSCIFTGPTDSYPISPTDSQCQLLSYRVYSIDLTNCYPPSHDPYISRLQVFPLPIPYTWTDQIPRTWGHLLLLPKFSEDHTRLYNHPWVLVSHLPTCRMLRITKFITYLGTRSGNIFPCSCQSASLTFTIPSLNMKAHEFKPIRCPLSSSSSNPSSPASLRADTPSPKLWESFRIKVPCQGRSHQVHLYALHSANSYDFDHFMAWLVDCSSGSADADAEYGRMSHTCIQSCGWHSLRLRWISSYIIQWQNCTAIH